MRRKRKAKKNPKKNPKTNPKANPRNRRSARRRRNPPATVSTTSILIGVIGGGVLAGAADYLAAGQTWAATPTRRAIGAGVVGGALTVAAVMTEGTARGVAAGAAGAFAAVASANAARMIGQAQLSKSDAEAVPKPASVLADAKGAMSGLIVPRATPAPAPAPAPARKPERMAAVVMDRSRMRALVVDPTAAMQAARRAGVAPAMLEPPRLVRPAAPGGRMGQLLVRGISR